MAPYPVTDSHAGNRIEVNEFIKDPLLIRETVLTMMNQTFLADAVLRNAGTAPSGTIRFRESNPLYADTAAQVRSEFAEVQVAEISLGKPMVAQVVELALAAIVSDEMVRRQNFDALQRQLMAIRNTMQLAWDRKLFDLLFTHPRVQHMDAASPWDDPNAKQRVDIYDAKRLVSQASADNTPLSRFGFKPDTMIIGEDIEAALFASDDFNRLYMNSPAITEAPIYKGQLDRRMYGLDLMVSPVEALSDKVVIMQRNICGFIAEELPLTVSPTYRVEERKFARADVQRAAASALDNPLAICVIDGVAA